MLHWRVIERLWQSKIFLKSTQTTQWTPVLVETKEYRQFSLYRTQLLTKCFRISRGFQTEYAPALCERSTSALIALSHFEVSQLSMMENIIWILLVLIAGKFLPVQGEIPHFQWTHNHTNQLSWPPRTVRG